MRALFQAEVLGDRLQQPDDVPRYIHNQFVPDSEIATVCRRSFGSRVSIIQCQCTFRSASVFFVIAQMIFRWQKQRPAIRSPYPFILS